MRTEPREKLWGKDPDWWAAVFAAIQLCVISVGLGSLSWAIEWISRREADAREIASLQTRITEDDPNDYKPAIEALFQRGPEGIAVINKFLSARRQECVPWSKAYLIISHSNPRSDSALFAASMEMLLVAWSCNSHDLGSDAQLYELIKRDPDKMCASVFDGLHIGRMEARLLPEAILIAILKDACPGESNQKFTALVSRFDEELRQELDPDIVRTESRFIVPWPSTPQLQGSLPGDTSFLRGPILDAARRFSQAGPNGSGVMWEELRYEPLWNRIVLGEVLLYFYKSAAGERNAIRSEDVNELNSWVAQGLRSSDRESRFAAVTAISNLAWNRYQKDLERLAAQDAEASVRWAADQALTYLRR